MNIIGVDPGVGGALALLDTERWTLHLADMPQESGVKNRKAVSPAGVADLIEAARPDHVFVEHVHSSPQMGVASAFSFGRSYGIVLGAAQRAGATLTEIKPAEWKRKTRTPKDKGGARKRAGQLFPSGTAFFSRVKDDGRAEAAVIALYGALFLNASPAGPIEVVEGWL